MTPSPTPVAATPPAPAPIVTTKALLVCIVEFRLWLDHEDLGNLTDGVRLVLPRTDERDIGKERENRALKDLATYISVSGYKGNLRYPLRWYGFYGLKTRRNKSRISPKEFSAFEDLLLASKTVHAVVFIRYRLTFNPDTLLCPPEILLKEKPEKAEKEKPVVKRAFKDKVIEMPKKRSTTTAKLL
jgi:hypothetical protein